MTYLTFNSQLRKETNVGTIATLIRKGWQETTPPTYNAATHRAPEWQDGQWVVTPLTPDEIAAATRKAWPTVSDFWAEFTSAEQLAIMDSAAPSLRLLLEALRMWRGEVWSDDARVTSGLDALTTAQVITDNRRKEIIAKTS